MKKKRKRKMKIMRSHWLDRKYIYVYVLIQSAIDLFISNELYPLQHTGYFIVLYCIVYGNPIQFPFSISFYLFLSLASFPLKFKY